MSYEGKWRIVETSAWDAEYLDESEDASDGREDLLSLW